MSQFFSDTPAGLMDELERQFLDADLFYGHGTDNARDEAAYLVLGALQLPFDADEDVLNQSLTDEQCERVRNLAAERIQTRWPVAYLINQAWFCGLPFYVDERVLIPRSPIAELIEERFIPWADEEKVTRIMDIGTGSGCIAVACALAFPGARVDAVDVSEEALAVAKINIEQHAVGDSVRVVQSDIFENLPDELYDLIVANPPYVDFGEMQDLPEEYRHEPGEVALAAGSDGLDIVRRILAGARQHLNPGGILIVEVGNSRQALEHAFPDMPFTWLEFERGGQGVFLLSAEQLDPVH
ncbi:MAG: 50S ribosomal protein L3 N(5)-glutamine methyltransferase [Gammaproteobacteria bacterium]